MTKDSALRLLRRILSVFPAASVCLLLGGCIGSRSADVDVDLAGMSSTVVYSEVFNMMMDPEPYVGKSIRMDGTLNIYHSQDGETTYFACLIADATECCAQGIEFVWEGEHDYPDDYPPEDSEIEVCGVFNSYEEHGQTFYHVTDATLDRI